ncbi:hypothetical protein [Streptomyces sp. SID3343]|uniref:hypothetical protein n=1 Tax=Streptomyces sp. SID3343 TaxID=2690260 RepID=UPI00136AED5A|nr:hypothetical protein [Streptomyces sp. SID3343]MYW00376.1 hypothetical protein [Streptomyces sp. SID3343]MYW04579.1 hypothetical protein [Streptomyces sp. SID3343]
MDDDLHSRIETLSDAACEVLTTVTATGWSPCAATDALGAIETLVGALGRLGPPARSALAPALAATATLRALISASPPGHDDATPRSGHTHPADPHRQPEYWTTRDMRVAEVLWLYAQEGRGGAIADLFASLPPQAMVEAVDRRGRGEGWRATVEELAHRHAT